MTSLEVDKRVATLSEDSRRIWKALAYQANMQKQKQRYPLFLEYFFAREKLAHEWDKKIWNTYRNPWRPTDEEEKEVEQLEKLCIEELNKLDTEYEASLAEYAEERAADELKLLEEVERMSPAEVATHWVTSALRGFPWKK